MSFIRLPVRLSQAGTVPKQLNVESRKKTPHDSGGTLVFQCQKSRRNSNGATPYWGDRAKQRWGKFTLAIFDQNLAASQKRCKIGT